LVDSTAKVEKMTLLASSSFNTKVAFSLGATVAPDTLLEAKLTSDVSIVAANRQLVKCITTDPITSFCTALRVKDSWCGDPHAEPAKGQVDYQVKDSEFWADIDDVSPIGLLFNDRRLSCSTQKAGIDSQEQPAISKQLITGCCAGYCPHFSNSSVGCQV
jgi:hypothetical protein